MPYKVLHLPTATFLYYFGNYEKLPALLCEIERGAMKPSTVLLYKEASFTTKSQAQAFVNKLIRHIKFSRELYKLKPDFYAGCLDKAFYSVIKVRD